MLIKIHIVWLPKRNYDAKVKRKVDPYLTHLDNQPILKWISGADLVHFAWLCHQLYVYWSEGKQKNREI